MLDVNSIIVGKEVGENGTPHLQGFIKFKKPMRLTSVKKILDRAHWEPAKGNDQQNLKYCSKQEVCLKKGVFSSGERGGGSATMALALQVKDKEYEDMSLIERVAYLKHERFLIRDKCLIRSATHKKRMRKYFGTVVLRAWQQELVKYCEGEPDERKIRWYYDPAGNNGKSFMTDYLTYMCDAKWFENGKQADIAFSYDEERIVIFDLSRSHENYINYMAIESFKNGRIWSGKYESCGKGFQKPHVIVFSNFYPDTTKLTEDRYYIIEFKTTGENSQVNKLTKVYALTD